MNKLTSLTIFFPFYNDAGTVAQAISQAYKYGRKVTNDLEVIAIHGGKSKDDTYEEIKKQKQKHKDLVIIDKTNNWESYAVIKYGFKRATKDWVFYTDGDLQYHLDELEKLVRIQIKTGADVANGYKINRGDNILRVMLGNCYKALSRIIFKLPIRDLTCDFRLIRRSFLTNIKFQSHDASILLELIKKLQKAEAKFAEIPVNHYKRSYGKSTYPISKLIRERVLGDLKLAGKLVK